MFHLHWKVNNRVSCNRKGLRERKSRKFWLENAFASTVNCSAHFPVSIFSFSKNFKWKFVQTHTLYLNEQMNKMVLMQRSFYSSALVSCRGVGGGNMKFNFVHNWPWQKAHFLAKNTILSLRTFSRPPLSSNLPLLLNLMLCSYLQNGIYKLLLRNAQKTVFILPPSIKVVDFLLLSSM